MGARVLSTLALAWSVPAILEAQTSGDLTGIVLDDTGAPVPGVTVLASSTGQGAVSRRFQLGMQIDI